MTAVEADGPEIEVVSPATVWAAPEARGGINSRFWHRVVKRAMDLALVVLMLPIAIPLMLGIALAIKAVSRGPVLFRQRRIGRSGTPFEMLKFRTMYVDAAYRLHADPELYANYLANDYKLPADEDPRLIPLGRLLRRTSLDELPQLWNVIRGQMSLVGPRPVVPGELQLYGELAGAYVQVRPGITGKWQTDGRNHIRYPERACVDADYVEHWSVWSDVVILLKTIPCVLRRRGSH